MTEENLNTPEYPKHTDLADFFIDDRGKIACTLNIDFKDFDVSHEQYLNGDDEYSEKEYEAIYSAVAKECNKSGEYTIDCYKERYTVRKTADINTIRYNDMTDEEKAAHDTQQQKNALYEEKGEIESELTKLDYIGVKIATGRATKEEYAAEISRMNKLAERINEIDEELAKL